MNTSQKIRDLSGEEFEDLMAYYYEDLGYMVEMTKKSGDQGIDILIRNEKENFDWEDIGIQCKNQKSKISQSTVRDFVGSIHTSICHKGYFVTTSNFTRQAREFADESMGFKLINGEKLMRMLEAKGNVDDLFRKINSNDSFRSSGLQKKVRDEPLPRNPILDKESQLLQTSSVNNSQIKIIGKSPDPIKLISLSLYKNHFDQNVTIIGEVLNEGEESTGIKVTTDWYDEKGKLVDTKYEHTKVSVLPPEEKSPFEIGIDKEFEPSKVEIDVKSADVIGDSPNDLDLTQVSLQKNESSFEPPEIIGKVKNNGNSFVESERLICSFYDEKGDIIGWTTGFPHQLDLPPNTVSSFEIPIEEDILPISAEDVEDYYIIT